MMDSPEQRAMRLRRMWQGKYVRTERVLSLDELPQWVPPGHVVAWQPGFTFGGEGLVEDFNVIRDTVCIEMDYGMGWVVDEKTIITQVPPQGTMPPGVH